MGDRSIALSCDEFPFASSEEGGNYYTTLSNNPTTAQRTCVPAWQNTLQRNCNSEFPIHSAFRHLVGLTSSSELLNKVQTNVLYYKNGGGVDFVQWNDSGWLSPGALGSEKQRFAIYPNQIPQGYGVDTEVRFSPNPELGSASFADPTPLLELHPQRGRIWLHVPTKLHLRDGTPRHLQRRRRVDSVGRWSTVMDAGFVSAVPTRHRWR